MKKNIALIIPSLNCGGAERSASILSNRLTSTGRYNIYIYSLDSASPFFPLDQSITVVNIDEKLHFANRYKKNIERIKYIKQLNKENDINLVIGYTIIGGILSSIACKKTNIKTIVCERSNPDIYGLFTKVIRFLAYQKADGAVFQTNGAKRYFKNIIKNSVVIPNFIEVNLLPDVVPYNQRKNKIVSVGRLEKEKNHRMLISAFATISDRYPDYVVEIYGDGSQFDNLNSYIKELKMENRIILKGKSNDVLNCIKDSRLFVFTSNYEGFPNALLEAMCMGIPSISTDCPSYGPRELIKDDEYGFLINVNDEKRLIDRMVYCLENNSVCENISNKAGIIRNRYDAKHIVNEWINYIDFILNKGEYNER